MPTTDDVRVELDDNVIDCLASLICGDDGPFYRTGRALEKFFEAAGWRRVGEVDGPSRRAWVIDTLKHRRRDSDALRDVILRLADPREYLDEDSAHPRVVQELNELLAVEGYQVVFRGGRPSLITQTPTLQRPLMKAPVQLTVNLASIVSDETFGRQLQSRLMEAQTCWDHGACTAAIIMLGSLLEGVLYDVALSQHTAGPRPNDNLESLINLAAERRWIAKDIVDYAHVLRNHRNLVHPRKQWTQGYNPEHDTVRIAWNVVVAALNDLEKVGRSNRGMS